MESESTEALQHGLLFCRCLRALVWQEGATLFTSVSVGDPWGPQGLNVSVRTVARLGQWGAPLLTGSVDKLINFISVSHTMPKPYWPDIHIFAVWRINLLHLLSLFFSFSVSFSFFHPYHITWVSLLPFFSVVLPQFGPCTVIFISFFLFSPCFFPLFSFGGIIYFPTIYNS